VEFQDKILRCTECGSEFVFTAGEQLFFHDKQFKHPPKRCKACKLKGLIPRVQKDPGDYFLGPTGLLRITFDSQLSSQQMKATLDALADHYRVCGGLGFEITWELEDLRDEKHALNKAIFANRLRA
jgi:DNA-directed RNA polymerase subunit RPC12/RpoP